MSPKPGPRGEWPRIACLPHIEAFVKGKLRGESGH
jgi:hypothetical protein